MVKILTSCFLLLSIFVVIYFPTVIFKHWREREREREKRKNLSPPCYIFSVERNGGFSVVVVVGGGVAPF
jgi:uncharacterized SAM-binding protein YcdF (DUF218 family)